MPKNYFIIFRLKGEKKSTTESGLVKEAEDQRLTETSSQIPVEKRFFEFS